MHEHVHEEAPVTPSAAVAVLLYCTTALLHCCTAVIKVLRVSSSAATSKQGAPRAGKTSSLRPSNHAPILIGCSAR